MNACGDHTVQVESNLIRQFVSTIVHFREKRYDLKVTSFTMAECRLMVSSSWKDIDMHELPVAENVLEITLRHASKADANRVTDLYLVIGQLSSIIDDSLQFYWDIISKDTIAEGARLHFRRIPTQLKCRDCGYQFTPGDDDFACPKCRSAHISITAGEEFFLESINIDN